MEKEPRMRHDPASTCFLPVPGRSRQTAKAQSKFTEMEKTIMVDTELPLPSWKLYDNPVYYSSQSHHHLEHPHCTNCLPSSAYRCAVSAWHHALINQARAAWMEELESSELENERRMRKKVELRNKRLARELAMERKAQKAMSRACEALAEKMERWKEEMEEERRMMRISEAWREERVRMKLAEARLLVEKRLEELNLKDRKMEKGNEEARNSTGKGQDTTVGRTQLSHTGDSGSNGGNVGMRIAEGRDLPESENRRGMKGLVEFRVVRPVGWRGRQPGFQVECQKAQLRLVLRHKCRPPAGLSVTGSNRLII